MVRFNNKLLKQLRKSTGLSLRQIEKDTGLSNPYLSQLETGHTKEPSFIVVVILARYFGVKLEDFVKETQR